MVATWEDVFVTWAKSPSQTEIEKIENSITAVKKALADDTKLSSITRVFVQGSYRNRVNVRQDSDVDIGALYVGETVGLTLPKEKSLADFGLVAATYSFADYKNDLEKALVKYFGSAHVTRGKKAFDIHENTYRVDADVVPLFVHRRYEENGSYICGTELYPDGGSRIINWPERIYDDAHWPNQHYEHGLTKNTETARAYRGVVRIVKKLRNTMDEAGNEKSKGLAGFFIECLVWNAPNSCFSHLTWSDDVKAVLDHISLYTSIQTLCNEWGEVSELKYLFKDNLPKQLQAKEFAGAALKYTGLS